MSGGPPPPSPLTKPESHPLFSVPPSISGFTHTPQYQGIIRDYNSRQQNATAASGRPVPSSRQVQQQQIQTPLNNNNPGGFYVIYGCTPPRIDPITGFMTSAVNPSTLPPGSHLAYVPDMTLSPGVVINPMSFFANNMHQIGHSSLNMQQQQQNSLAANSIAKRVTTEDTRLNVDKGRDLGRRAKEEEATKDATINSSFSGAMECSSSKRREEESMVDVVGGGDDIFLPPFPPCPPLLRPPPSSPSPSPSPSPHSSSSFHPLATSTPAMRVGGGVIRSSTHPLPPLVTSIGGPVTSTLQNVVEQEKARPTVKASHSNRFFPSISARHSVAKIVPVQESQSGESKPSFDAMPILKPQAEQQHTKSTVTDEKKDAPTVSPVVGGRGGRGRGRGGGRGGRGGRKRAESLVRPGPMISAKDIEKVEKVLEHAQKRVVRTSTRRATEKKVEEAKDGELNETVDQLQEEVMKRFLKKLTLGANGNLEEMQRRNALLLAEANKVLMKVPKKEKE